MAVTIFCKYKNISLLQKLEMFNKIIGQTLDYSIHCISEILGAPNLNCIH